MKSSPVGAWVLATLLAFPSHAVAEPPDEAAAAVVDAIPAGEDREIDRPAAREAYAAAKLKAEGSDREPYAVRGDGRVLRGGELYRTLGRGDLVWRYRLWLGAELALYGGGATAFGLSLYYFLSEPAPCTPLELRCDLRQKTEESDQRTRGLVWFVGAAALVSYAFFVFEPAPVDRSSMDRLVATHNRKLRRKLGVLDVSALGLDGALIPVAAPGAVGLGLQGTF